MPIKARSKNKNKTKSKNRNKTRSKNGNKTRSKTKSKSSKKQQSLNQFKKLHGCSTKCADDLYQIGMRNYSDIKRSDPDTMFNKLTKLKGKQDKCVLYVLRCIHYQVTCSKSKCDKKLMLWWNWKD